MARKQKLSGSRQERILRRIETRVREGTFAPLLAEIEAAQAALTARADVIAEESFPTSDMLILKEYKVAVEHNQLLVCATSPDEDGSVNDQFNCSTERLFPDDWAGRRALIKKDDPIFQLEKDRDALQAKLNEELTTVMRDYRAVVCNSIYFEDLVELVPEVAAMEAELYPAQGALSVLTRDVIDRVRADQERLAA